MNTLAMAIAGLDREILLTLNSFGGGNTHLWELANNSLFRGFPLFFSLPALWFSDGRERRGRMLAGLLAVCLATIFSVWFQFHIDVHTRPHSGSGTSSGNRHSTMDVGSYEFVSERHGDVVFRPCRGRLRRGAIGRAILLCLGRSDHRDSSGDFRVSLCKRHHRFTGAGIGMRFHFCQESIPKAPV